MSKVSIIIPVYGVEKYIERCVRSLFGQTLDSIEYIFVDDRSPDGSISVMQKVLEEYPHRKEQVRIIRHEVNQGVGAARNHGVAACTGDYVIHCDPDDWVDCDLYEKLWKKAVETNADAVYFPMLIEFENSNLPPGKIPLLEVNDVQTYIKKTAGIHLNSLGSKLYKKQAALDPSLNCPEHICLGEDLLRNIQMLDQCKTMAFVPDTCYHYRQNAASITHNFTSKHFDYLQNVIDIIEEKYPEKYSNIRMQLKTTILLEAIKNLYIKNGSPPLFHEVWDKTPFRNKMGMLFFGKSLRRVKLILIALCISKSVTIALLKLIRRSK